MKRSTKLAIRLSEIREKLNGPPESLNDEERAALEKESLEIEAKYRAALESEARESDDPQFRSLALRLECRAYMEACVRETALQGREAEFNKEQGLRDGEMPWEALVPDDEHRADTATTVPAAAVGETQMSILERVFRDTDASFFGVTMPSVASGHPIYPVLTGGASGDMANPGVGVDAEAATITAVTISPYRASAAYLLRVEDAAQFVGYEPMLRRDLRMALGQLMDSVVVLGNAASPDINGLIEHATAESGAAPGEQLAIANLDAVVAGGIDGVYVNDPMQVSLYMGLETGRLLRSKRDTGTAENPAMTLGEYSLAAGRGPVRVSSLVADPSSGIQTNYRFSRAAMRAVAPVWSGVMLIRDPYTNAASGQVRITATMLFGFDVVRHDLQAWRAKVTA